MMLAPVAEQIETEYLTALPYDSVLHALMRH